MHFHFFSPCPQLASQTYKVLTTTQPSYLHVYNLISVQPHRSTHSSDVVTLSCPPSSSSLKSTTALSVKHQSPCLWNQLPKKLRLIMLCQYQIIPLADRGTQVWITCPRLLHSSAWTGVTPSISWLQVQCSTDRATMSLIVRHKIEMGLQSGHHLSSGITVALQRRREI